MHESMLATLGLGFVLGLKHATEADHLAAVSTIVSERRSLWQSATVGVLWGAGHTTSLLVTGLLILGVGFIIPDRLANVFEFAVAIMTILLGMRLLHLHVHSHTHGSKSHMHLHFEQEPHRGTDHTGLAGWRPVLIGMMHGLAGSAGLTLLVLSQVVRNGGAALGLAYIAVFGFGSIGGMLLMSTVMGLPFSLRIRFLQRAVLPLRLVAGIFSTIFGLLYAIRIAERLL